MAKKASYFALSWYYMWDVPFAKGQMLGDLGLKSRGWGNVSVRNNFVQHTLYEVIRVLEKLREKGFKDFDHQKLFEIFFENDKLREQIINEIEENSEIDFKELSKRKNELITNLDNLLVETYQTSPVLIDDAKLVTVITSYSIHYTKLYEER